MKSKKSFFRTVEPYLYLVPVMILFILFVFWPFVKTIQLSFARTTPLGQVAQYVGLDNYTNIFTDGTFLNSLVATLKFSVMRVILSIVLGFIHARQQGNWIHDRGVRQRLHSGARVHGLRVVETQTQLSQ